MKKREKKKEKGRTRKRKNNESCIEAEYYPYCERNVIIMRIIIRAEKTKERRENTGKGEKLNAHEIGVGTVQQG